MKQYFQDRIATAYLYRVIVPNDSHDWPDVEVQYTLTDCPGFGWQDSWMHRGPSPQLFVTLKPISKKKARKLLGKPSSSEYDYYVDLTVREPNVVWRYKKGEDRGQHIFRNDSGWYSQGGTLDRNSLKTATKVKFKDLPEWAK